MHLKSLIQQSTTWTLYIHYLKRLLLTSKERIILYGMTLIKDVLINDIVNKQQYKIIIDKEIACVFSVCKSDPLIWREKEKGDAIYLHRIVVNPKYKGYKQFKKILNWSIDFAKRKKIRFIRMDTWAHNSNILDYYKSYGFKFSENFKTSDSSELTIQNRNIEVALLEYVIS